MMGMLLFLLALVRRPVVLVRNILLLAKGRTSPGGSSLFGLSVF